MHEGVNSNNGSSCSLKEKCHDYYYRRYEYRGGAVLFSYEMWFKE